MAASVFMLDTDMLIFIIRGLKRQHTAAASFGKAERILDRIRREQAAGARVGVSAVTVSELEYGTCRSKQPIRERHAVTKVLAPFELFDYDAVSAPRHYGEIRAQLEAVGVPIGAMDLLIAAHARALGATLITSNTAEFCRVNGLRCANWAEPPTRV